MFFGPTRCLVVTEADEPSSAGDTHRAPNTASVTPLGRLEDADIARRQERVRRSGGIGGLIALVGFMLIVVGMSTTSALVIVGGIAVAAGLGWNIRTMVRARRLFRSNTKDATA